jgi:hypothetical protein
VNVRSHATVDALNALRAELQAAEHMLSTQYSSELAEPNYRRCLSLIEAHERNRRQIVELMTSMFDSGEITEEPIAYLMHCLRWEEVRSWAEAKLRAMEHPMLYGRALGRICEAFADNWEDREFYSFRDA